MTSSLTPLGLFLQAGPVAKAVFLLLLAASIWCWVLIIEGLLSIRRLNQGIRVARTRERHSPNGRFYESVHKA